MVYKPLNVIVLVLLCSCTSFLRAQDYALLYPERAMTFAIRDALGEDSLYFFTKVTATVSEPDGTAYYFQVPIDTASADLCTTDTAILGSKMLVLSDTPEGDMHVFFNSEGDSIFIRNNLAINETWRFYTFEDGSYIRARVVNYNEFGILPGITDSLYRVRLNVFAEDDTALPGVFPDDFKFDISKHYGMTEVWDFYNFPENQQQYLLRGLDNPKEAITDVDAAAAFALESGYEVHYTHTMVHEDSVWTTLGGDFILEATPIGLPVGFSFSVKRVGITTLTVAGSIVSIDTFYTIEDMDVAFEDYSYLDSLERIPVVLPDGRISFSEHTYNPANYNGVRYKTFNSAYYPGTGSVCLEPDADNIFTQRFGDGMGMLYELDSSAADAYSIWEAVYFQKGLITWGTPFDFEALGVVSVDEAPIANTWNVFPNPVSGACNISGMVADATTYIELFDISGRKVLSQTGSTELRVNHLDTGIYLLKITHQGQTARMQVQVQH